MPLRKSDTTASAAATVVTTVSANATASVNDKNIATNANGVIQSNLAAGNAVYTKKEIDDMGFMSIEEGKDVFVEQTKFMSNMEIDNMMAD